MHACLCANEPWAERIGWEGKRILAVGLGISGRVAKDGENKVRIDKVEGGVRWRKLKENKWEGKKASISRRVEQGGK